MLKAGLKSGLTASSLQCGVRKGKGFTTVAYTRLPVEGCKKSREALASNAADPFTTQILKMSISLSGEPWLSGA